MTQTSLKAFPVSLSVSASFRIFQQKMNHVILQHHSLFFIEETSMGPETFRIALPLHVISSLVLNGRDYHVAIHLPTLPPHKKVLLRAQRFKSFPLCYKSYPEDSHNIPGGKYRRPVSPDKNRKTPQKYIFFFSSIKFYLQEIKMIGDQKQ